MIWSFNKVQVRVGPIERFDTKRFFMKKKFSLDLKQLFLPMKSAV